MAFGLVAGTAHGSEVVCPDSLEAASAAGWEIDTLDSEILKKKPHLAITPKQPSIVITRNVDRELAISFPVEQSDVNTKRNGTLEYVWDYTGLSEHQRSEKYFACIYRGEARRYARKPMPTDTDWCKAIRPKGKPFPTRLTCKP